MASASGSSSAFPAAKVSLANATKEASSVSLRRCCACTSCTRFRRQAYARAVNLPRRRDLLMPQVLAAVGVESERRDAHYQYRAVRVLVIS